MCIFQSKINGTQWEKWGKGKIKAGKGKWNSDELTHRFLKKALLLSEVEFLLYLIFFHVIYRVAQKV